MKTNTQTKVVWIFAKEIVIKNLFGTVVEWLERRDCDQHNLGSKPTRAILLCLCERHFTALSPTSWS